MTLCAVAAEAIALGGATFIAGFALRTRLAQLKLAIFSGTVSALFHIALWVPASMSEFTLKSRRAGIENRLRELQRASPGCLRRDAACNEVELRAVRAVGCTAVNGIVDERWPHDCLLTRDAIELTRNGGVALAVFRQDGTPPDVWLLTSELLVTLGPPYASEK